MNATGIDALIGLKLKLNNAIENKRSAKRCLTLWSHFIRTRDAHRCVNCESTHRIQAHHIFRKVVYPYGWFELGNGITLCRDCHRMPHAISNKRPNLAEPINAKGGDDQDEISYLYGTLLDDAEKRGLNHDEFYYIHNKMLQFFVAVQGYEDLYWSVQAGRISRLRMAHEIWRAMPQVWYADLARKLVESNFPET